MEERNSIKTTKRRGRTLLIAAVIAVLLVGTALAVTYPSWSPGLLEYLIITDEEAAGLEDTELVSRPQASDTQEGVTMSLEQLHSSPRHDDNLCHRPERGRGAGIPRGKQRR